MKLRLMILLASTFGIADIALAQADPATVAATERVKAETELEKARAERDRAEADKIKALGLPSFEGTTHVGTNGGAMEATLLSAQALGAVARAVASDPDIAGRPKIIVIALNDNLDLSQANIIQLEMAVIAKMFDDARIAQPESLAGLISAGTALAGLLRSETTLSGIDTPALDDRLLIWSIAGKLGDKAVLPAAAIAGEAGTKAESLYRDLNSLVSRRSAAESARLSLAKIEKPTAVQKMQLVALNAVAARHDAFAARVTTVNANGVVPIIAAGRMADLLGTGAPVLRVHVDRAGGSLVNSKNLATFFGMDPLKISGGLIVSYLLTDPSAGTVIRSNVLSCHTTYASIRAVQQRSAKLPANSCVSLVDG